ncbi:extracellular solute-binding protein [Globicatella sulfidifaciens]|uniref:Extracellular solute-binding protein n=1 Tax=Globicatella sulfidifaciens TaxID=136093 RepID=A0A7X8H1F1_9LACT|nr:extracellular solute-binding protein [Globicatella sulfidifaciens]NLJ19496.1 extracellular solute-binding protein [Globicatella sulfidifaciens]
MKNVIGLILIMILLGVVGCGNQTIIGEDYSKVEEELEVELVIWHTYSEHESYVFENEIIPLFEEEYPTIKITSVRQPYDSQLRNAMISRISSDMPPDILRLDIAWLSSFAKLDLLYPVSDFEDFEQIKSIFYEEPLQSNFYQGKYYGLPLNSNTKVSIFNKELLEHAGVEKPPETMDELILFVKENDYVIALDHFSIWDTLHYFNNLGGEFTSPDYTRTTGYLNNDASVEAISKLVDLYQGGYLHFANDKWNGILEDKYVMIDEGPWFYSVNTEEQIELINQLTVAVPFMEYRDRNGIIGGENLVISKGTDYKEEAWLFLKWMTTETPQRYMAEAGLIPSNKSVELSGFYEEYPYYQVYLNNLDQGVLRPPLPQWWDIEELYSHYMNRIFSGEMPIEEGLTEAAYEIDQVIIE